MHDLKKIQKLIESENRSLFRFLFYTLRMYKFPAKKQIRRSWKF